MLNSTRVTYKYILQQFMDYRICNVINAIFLLCLSHSKASETLVWCLREAYISVCWEIDFSLNKDMMFVVRTTQINNYRFLSIKHRTKIKPMQRMIHQHHLSTCGQKYNRDHDELKKLWTEQNPIYSWLGYKRSPNKSGWVGKPK